jgi:hypothetical protein
MICICQGSTRGCFSEQDTIVGFCEFGNKPFFTVFIPKTAQQLGTKLYNLIASLLHVLAFFGHLQGDVIKKNTTLANYVMAVQL